MSSPLQKGETDIFVTEPCDGLQSPVCLGDMASSSALHLGCSSSQEVRVNGAIKSEVPPVEVLFLKFLSRKTIGFKAGLFKSCILMRLQLRLLSCLISRLLLLLLNVLFRLNTLPAYGTSICVQRTHNPHKGAGGGDLPSSLQVQPGAAQGPFSCNPPFRRCKRLSHSKDGLRQARSPAECHYLFCNGPEPPELCVFP